MINKIRLLLAFLLLSIACAFAQVPVSEEPFHHPVFLNQYIRLLDVWIKPRDTTRFHIHSTPSLFIQLSNTNISSQVKGEKWVKEQSVSGKVWYRSFSPDILIHRVTNSDTGSFHVNDVEILSSYDTTDRSGYKPFPLTILFENEKATAYRITDQKEIRGKLWKSRGPLIVELVAGKRVMVNYVMTNQTKEILTGQFLYIDPNTSFYFITAGVPELNMVMFEIK